MAPKKAKLAAEQSVSRAPTIKVREPDEAEMKFLESCGFKPLTEGVWYSEDRMVHFCREILENPWFGEIEKKGKKQICKCCKTEFTDLDDPVSVLRVL